MADPVVPTEPVANADPKNNGGAAASAPVAPAATGTNDEAETLRKQLEQATMRANQLENEKAARDKAVEEAQRKQLEENNEFKQLYEKSANDLEALRKAQETEQEQTALAAATQEVFKGFPQEVVEVAQTAGISLTDNSDTGRAALTEKLNSIKDKVVPSGASAAGGTNPYNPAPAAADRTALVTRDPETGVTPMAMSAAKGDLRPTLEYIGGLDAVNTMKVQSGFYKLGQ